MRYFRHGATVGRTASAGSSPAQSPRLTLGRTGSLEERSDAAPVGILRKVHSATAISALQSAPAHRAAGRRGSAGVQAPEAQGTPPAAPPPRAQHAGEDEKVPSTDADSPRPTQRALRAPAAARAASPAIATPHCPGGSGAAASPPLHRDCSHEQPLEKESWCDGQDALWQEFYDVEIRRAPSDNDGTTPPCSPVLKPAEDRSAFKFRHQGQDLWVPRRLIVETQARSRA